MYQKLFSICILLASFSTLSFGQTEPNPSETLPPMVGGDTDVHGCKPSAGYTFSVLKNDCIRTFEQPIQLNEVKSKNSYTSFAAVIFSDDKKQVEIFMPSVTGSVVLSKKLKTKFPTWQKGNIILTKRSKYYLKQANRVIFVGK
ncbi:hypothetical protein LV89_00140 [Arcicella aurantiaca]|uniref:Uncharacterized protein n=1 Tax=Arcicella aurantiaca TaxID=591202 RepID=A0A316EFD5_9BACT|nr:hypothetical protein [Arcicella aurantiaca]PWK29300.1 hypothetical protein LV89_00140 [Arcicella aurantiaca]